MKRNPASFALALPVVLALAPAAPRADVRLPAVISDG